MPSSEAYEEREAHEALKAHNLYLSINKLSNHFSSIADLLSYIRGGDYYMNEIYLFDSELSQKIYFLGIIAELYPNFSINISHFTKFVLKEPISKMTHYNIYIHEGFLTNSEDIFYHDGIYNEEEASYIYTIFEIYSFLFGEEVKNEYMKTLTPPSSITPQ
jgi:hypothetical protein